ncbi:MAG: hypothetical protein KJZ80_01360 [Hyphomicrobiaceae bacterium]|nr:hypothetical protein [Hyphomicrobiaceae bacterium]
MNTLRLVALGAGALIALTTLVTATAEAAKCVMAGGSATGLTQDIAKVMATNALGQSISSYGGKASGKVAMKCDANMLMSTCTAKQRACK